MSSEAHQPEITQNSPETAPSALKVIPIFNESNEDTINRLKAIGMTFSARGEPRNPENIKNEQELIKFADEMADAIFNSEHNGKRPITAVVGVGNQANGFTATLSKLIAQRFAELQKAESIHSMVTSNPHDNRLHVFQDDRKLKRAEIKEVLAGKRILFVSSILARNTLVIDVIKASLKAQHNIEEIAGILALVMRDRKEVVEEYQKDHLEHTIPIFQGVSLGLRQLAATGLSGEHHTFAEPQPQKQPQPPEKAEPNEEDYEPS